MVETMGTVFSLDVRGGEPGAVRAALEEAAAGLRRVDEVFSTYREDTQISRLARGELDVGQCDPEVAEVLELAAEAERVSDGWFSTRYRGQLDPTGIVKGWGLHKLHEDRYFVVRGEMELVTYDPRPESSTYGKICKVYLSAAQPRLVNVPRNVWHADHNIGVEDVIVVNFPTIQYDHSSPDKYRLPIDTDLIPYDFGPVRGW